MGWTCSAGCASGCAAAHPVGYRNVTNAFWKFASVPRAWLGCAAIDPQPDARSATAPTQRVARVLTTMSYACQRHRPQTEGTARTTGRSEDGERGRPHDASVAMLAILAALSFLPGAPHPPAPTPPPPVAYGTITVCAAAGSRPVTGPLLFSLAAPASAGGSQTLNL